MSYKSSIAQDAITGEPLGDIRIGSVDELRLFRVQRTGERNDSGIKLFFGPPDDVEMQTARYMAYISRINTYDEENMQPNRKRRGKRYNKPLEIASNQLFPGEFPTF
tara:strand:- start:1735 stop:2055 length:321 start_codon:yes stop_codon:yes gene_type:complete